MAAIERPDWGPPTAAQGVGETASAAAAPARAAMQLVESEVGETNQARVAQADDVDDGNLYRKLLADGLFTPEELGRHYGLSREEIDVISKPLPKPPSRRLIEDELAAIDHRRRTDRIAYFKDEDMQERERELIDLRDKMKAAPNGGKKTVDEDASRLDPALVAAWEREGGLEVNLATARNTAQTALDQLESDEQASLTETFDVLPAASQMEILKYIAIEPANWRPADQAAVDAFASTSEGRELIEEWGEKAARHVGVVQGRIGLMLGNMPAADRDTAEAWFDALTPAQAKAVMKSLIGNK